MTQDERMRFEALRAQSVSALLIRELLGVDPMDSYFERRFLAFLRRSTLWKHEGLTRDHVNRFAFELFLTRHRLLSLRTGAARLGMHEASLASVLDALDDRGDIILDLDGRDAGVVSESVVKDLHRNFKSLEAVIFNDHDEYCEHVHRTITDELGVDVTALMCTTAARLGERHYAWQLCAISHHPVSPRYEVALELAPKPIRLRPDVCSLDVYARARDELERFVFGVKPDEEHVQHLAA